MDSHHSKKQQKDETASAAQGPRAPSELTKTFEAHYDEVRLFVDRQLGRRQDRDDVVHEIYEEVLRYPPREAVREPRAWIYRVAWRVVHRAYERAKLQRRRAVAVDTKDLDRLMSREGATASDACSQLESEESLRAALRGLPAPSQYAFVRSRRDGYSYQEIAKELNVSREMVKKHIGRALHHIDLYLAARERSCCSGERQGGAR